MTFGTRAGRPAAGMPAQAGPEADTGGNVVETVGACGQREEILGELLEGGRDRLVLATR